MKKNQKLNIFFKFNNYSIFHLISFGNLLIAHIYILEAGRSSSGIISKTRSYLAPSLSITFLSFCT
jgi:hypothetical protein